MTYDICGDNRFEIIEKAKRSLIESTNIETSEDEMKVIDSFLVDGNEIKIETHKGGDTE